MIVAMLAFAAAGCGVEREQPAAPPERAAQGPKAIATPSPPAAPALSLTAAGYDTIRIGATPAQAGYGLADDGAYQDRCRIYQSPRLPGVAAMVDGGVIRRVTLYTGRRGSSPIRTDRGIGVGSTEAAVRAAYAQVDTQPHEYAPAPAKNLFYGDESDKSALRFEIGADGRVSELHAGVSPWLGYVESCS